MWTPKENATQTATHALQNALNRDAHRASLACVRSSAYSISSACSISSAATFHYPLPLASLNVAPLLSTALAPAAVALEGLVAALQRRQVSQR